MKCPTCGQELYEYQAGAILVDICRDGCSGIWLDKSELEKCDEHNEPFPEDLLRIRKVANVVVDRSKTRSCPCCEGQALSRVVLDPEIRFEIDRCPKCEGNWLDIGELEYIRLQEKKDSELNQRLKTYDEQVSRRIEDANARYGVKAAIKKIFGA